MEEKELLGKIKLNVIQGRKVAEDEGLDEDITGPGVTELVSQALKEGIGAKEIIEAAQAAMKEVGEKYETGEYFIPDMLVSAEATAAAMNILEPYLVKGGEEKLSQIVMATVQGDQHDIGKNLVSIVLKGAAFEVIDLGTDVPSDQIIETAKDKNAKVIGLSALLTTTMPKMKEVVDLVKKENLPVTVIIGGAPVTQEYAEQIGADAYGEDAFQAVEKVRSLLEQGEKCS